MSKIYIPWRKDSFLSKNGNLLTYDKLEHALLAFLGILLSLFFIPSRDLQVFMFLFLIINTMGLAWEIFQLVIQKQLIQPKDIAANNIGLIASVLLFM